jgi:hypothetical protein
MTTPSLDAALAFFAGLLGGTVDGAGSTGAGTAWTELRWPGSGRVRFEEDRDATPGIARLELVGAGADRELEVAGTLLVVRGADRPVEADQSLR